MQQHSGLIRTVICDIGFLRARFKRHNLISDELIHAFFKYRNFPNFCTSHQFDFNLILRNWMGPVMGPLSGKN